MVKNKRLIRFKDQHSKEPIYVNIDDIFSICKSTDSSTIITSNNGFTVTVEEHIAEVVAIIEERDSLPAKVLFGTKSED